MWYTTIFLHTVHSGCEQLGSGSFPGQIHDQQHANYQGGHDKVEYHRNRPYGKEIINEIPHDVYPLLLQWGTTLIERSFELSPIFQERLS